MPGLLLLTLLWLATPALAEGFRCAGSQGIPTTEAILPPDIAAKPAQATPSRTTGTRRALVLFARFKGEPANPVPAWAADIFNPNLPGSFSHFYDTMSFGRLQVRGEVGPRVYESEQPAAVYLAGNPFEQGRFGELVLEVLRQADQDLDFAQFDSDGPDGMPDSGDDDGVVDAVFVVLERVPTGFLLAEATGIGDLGFNGGYSSQDAGRDGVFVEVRGSQGTVQQGRFFAEAVGAMCHEYGHVLGLPDLYDTEFFRKPGAGPEEDSAGVGAWCLMGWGASGWKGNDGPNSFCAWSRVQLGWAEVETPAQEHQELRLQEVGARGSVFKLPLHHDEHFLVEYRRRTSTYYDRNLPGEGLLLWHVSGNGPDLECADGRWQDAGYPQGEIPHPRTGGDNLDFWAHDGTYAQAHAGNLGDETDPFDGIRFASFTPRSNPSSHSANGRLSVRLEGVHLQGDTAIAQVQALPLKASIRNLVLRAEGSGKVLLAGEQIQVTFVVTNEGGAPLEKVLVRLRSDDPLVEVVRAEVDFGTLKPGETTARYAGGDLENLSFRFTTGFAGVHTAHLILDTFAEGILTGQFPFEASGLSPQQEVLGIAVLDSAGNGDGQAQGGEIIRLKLGLAGEQGVLEQDLGFSLRPLNAGMVLIGSAEARFDGLGSLVSPEVLLPADLPPGTRLEFQLLAISQYSAWIDTLAIELQPGPDLTPPRILSLGSGTGSAGFRLVLAESNLLDGSALTRVYAVIHTRRDTTQIATVPLNHTGHRYEGFWPGSEEGKYLIEVVAIDAAGNVGRGALQEFEVFLRDGVGLEGLPSHWEALPFPSDEHLHTNANLYLAPGDSGAIYLSASQGIWCSMDGGKSWVGIAMNGWPGGAVILFQDAPALYLKGLYPLRSRDGGQHWEAAFVDPGIQLLAADPVNPERLYGTRDGRLAISADAGISWQETSILPQGTLRVHPHHPQVLYAGALSYFDAKRGGLAPGALYRSGDGGQTWDTWALDQVFADLALDPQIPERLYATTQGMLWMSEDSGKSWELLHTFQLAGGLPAISIAVGADGTLVVWNSGEQVLWQSQDGGQSWVRQELPQGMAGRIALDPRDPQHFLLVITEQNLLYQTYDGGLNWESYPLPQLDPPAGALAFDAAGRLVASAARQTSQGEANGLFASDNGGSTWKQLGWESFHSYGFADFLYTDPYEAQFLVARAAFGYTVIDGAEQSSWSFSPFLAFTQAYPEIIAPWLGRKVYYLAELGVWRLSPREDGFYAEPRSVGLPQRLGASGRGYTPEVSGLAIDPEHPTTLYAAIGDSLWRTQDEGLHWEYHNQVGEGGTIYALHRHPLATKKIYAATKGGLYLSENEGETWTLLAHPEIKGLRKMRLRFDAHDPQRILWITGTQLLESEDGGHTWYRLEEGLTGLPWISDAAFDRFDPAVVYAATSWGVYRLDSYETDSAVEETAATPATFSLSPNYPNPFNPTTTLRFSLPQAGEAELSIYNLLGQRVATLVRGIQEAGLQVLQWNGRDEQGRELASGVYLCRLQAGGQMETRKLLLLR